MTEVDLQQLLDELSSTVKVELKSNPEVVEDDDLDLSKLPVEARRWHKIHDVVAVLADLKSSTKLGTGKRDRSTASIYQASTGGLVKIFDQFDADYIDIQGDGAFALFWGELRYERAICAGITVKTFSEDLVSQLEKRWPDLPETGFKVGVASSRLLVKRVGTPRKLDQQKPVWPGKAVNYSAKAAQGADRHELVVTGTVWDEIEKNDYLAASCSCGTGPSLDIWVDTEIERLAEDDSDRQGRLLSASWCKEHGVEYCEAVLEGKRRREDVNHLRKALQESQWQTTLRQKAQKDRQTRRAWQQGLR